MRVADIKEDETYVGKDGHLFRVIAKTAKWVAFTDNGKNNPAVSPRRFAAYMVSKHPQ
jgi:hypothetical protein